MADKSKNFVIRVLQVTPNADPNIWGVPVTSPIECSKIVIENQDTSTDMQVRTDPADGGTQKTLPKTLELTIQASNAPGAVFQPGETVCVLAPATGNGPLVAVVSFSR